MKRNRIIGIALFITAIAAGTNLNAGDGKEIYAKECARCHGADGKGETKMGKKWGARDYTDAKVQEDVTDERAIKAVKDGYKDKAGKTVMKPAEGMTDADIKAVVTYLRSFKK